MSLSTFDPATYLAMPSTAIYLQARPPPNSRTKRARPRRQTEPPPMPPQSSKTQAPNLLSLNKATSLRLLLLHPSWLLMFPRTAFGVARPHGITASHRSRPSAVRCSPPAATATATPQHTHASHVATSLATRPLGIEGEGRGCPRPCLRRPARQLLWPGSSRRGPGSTRGPGRRCPFAARRLRRGLGRQRGVCVIARAVIIAARSGCFGCHSRGDRRAGGGCAVQDTPIRGLFGVFEEPLPCPAPSVEARTCTAGAKRPRLRPGQRPGQRLRWRNPPMIND